MQADCYCILGEGAAFREFAGITAEEREIVGAFCIAGRVGAEFRPANFESLPEEALAVLQIAGGVLEESEAIETAAKIPAAQEGSIEVRPIWELPTDYAMAASGEASAGG